MKTMVVCCITAIWALALSPAASAFTASVYSGTYLDASAANTAAVNGTTPWYSSADSTSLWKERTPLSNNGTIFEAGYGAAQAGDHLRLVTTASGLTPGGFYRVYVVFWTADAQDWRVWAGLTEDSMTMFSKANSKDTTAQEADRSEYEGYLGVAIADAAGTVKAYIDDQLNYTRTWYDGIVIAPTQAVFNIAPLNNAKDLGPSVNFAWQMAPQAVLSHQLIVCPSEPNAASPLAQKYTVTDMINPIEYTAAVLPNQTYYWRVDEKVSDANTVEGQWWSFSSIVDIPTFTAPYGSQPVSAAAFVGDQVKFNAPAGVSPQVTGTIAYQWYCGQPGDTSTPVFDSVGHISGSTSSELTIQVQLADEKAYWCQATLNGKTGNSNAAVLSIKKLLAHYTFDDTLNDSMPGANHASMTAPAYAAGISGKGLVFGGTQYASIPAAAYPRAGDGNGLANGSVSFWIQTNAIATGASFFGTANTAPDNTRLLLTYANGNRLQAYVRNAANQEMFFEVLPGGAIYNNAWHLLTFTWDTAAGSGKIYIDGVLAIASNLTAIAGFNPWQYPIYIGAYNNAGAAAGIYTGTLDDLRIYNYPISAAEAAQLYVNFNPGTVICAEKPAYDTNNDCKVNLSDLTPLVTEWLECNLVPANCL